MSRGAEQLEVAELIQGDVMFHNFYASLLPDSEASADDDSLVPHWFGEPAGLETVVSAGHRRHKQQPGAAHRLLVQYSFSWPSGVWPLQWRMSKVRHTHST